MQVKRMFLNINTLPFKMFSMLGCDMRGYVS